MVSKDLEDDSKQTVETSVGIEPAHKKADAEKADPANSKNDAPTSNKVEIGGRKKGLDPTRYGDWEKNGRCIDF